MKFISLDSTYYSTVAWMYETIMFDSYVMANSYHFNSLGAVRGALVHCRFASNSYYDRMRYRENMLHITRIHAARTTTQRR